MQHKAPAGEAIIPFRVILVYSLSTKFNRNNS